MNEHKDSHAKPHSLCASSFLPAECIHHGKGGRACVEPELVPLRKGFARLSGCPSWVPATDPPQATSRMSVRDLILLFSNRYPIC